MGNIEKAFQQALIQQSGAGNFEDIGLGKRPEPVRAEATPMADDLVLRLERACVGSCSCNMKTSVWEYHGQTCPYRLYTEAIVALVQQDPNRMKGSELEFLNESNEKVVVSAQLSVSNFVVVGVKKGGNVNRKLHSIKEFRKLREVMNAVHLPD